MDELEISSPVTSFLMKFIWPVGWLGSMSCFNLLALGGSPWLRWGSGVAPAWGPLLLLGLLLLGLVVTHRVSVPLKRLWLAADGLRVSNYLGEAFVLWRHVRRVTVHGDFGLRRIPLVEIQLWQPHPFGGRISLLPASKDRLAELTARAAASGVNFEYAASRPRTAPATDAEAGSQRSR